MAKKNLRTVFDAGIEVALGTQKEDFAYDGAGCVVRFLVGISGGGSAGRPSPRSLVKVSAVRAGCDVPIHRSRTFYQFDEHDLARMVPRAFPRPQLVIYVTGVLEFLGATGLLLPRFRQAAAFCLIVLLMAMFPHERESSAGSPHAARQTRHRALAARAHAVAIHRPSLVVQGALTVTSLDS